MAKEEKGRHLSAEKGKKRDWLFCLLAGEGGKRAPAAKGNEKKSTHPGREKKRGGGKPRSTPFAAASGGKRRIPREKREGMEAFPPTAQEKRILTEVFSPE